MSDDSLIYGIPKKDLIKDPIQLENGTYYNFKTYNLYVPNEVSADTSAYIYYPGSGGSGHDDKIINNIINTGNTQQIIVIPDDPYRDRKTDGEGHLQLINTIGAENDVEITHVNMMGFSAGGPATFGTLINTIEQNPDSGPHNAVFCDVVDFTVNQEQIDLLIRDNSTLLFFEPNKQITKFETDLAKAGVDVIICRTYGAHAEHSTVNREALLNGVIDFSAGLADTMRNSDIYTFQVYDHETGEFKDISIDEVARKFATFTDSSVSNSMYQKLANITELKSDNTYLASKVNNIRSVIRNTGFLSSSGGDSYSSTTLVPSSLGTLVQDYFSTCSGLLSKIESDTRQIIEIGEEIDRMNDELAKEAELLNQSDTLYNDMGVSKVIGSDYSEKSGDVKTKADELKSETKSDTKTDSEADTDSDNKSANESAKNENPDNKTTAGAAANKNGNNGKKETNIGKETKTSKESNVSKKTNTSNKTNTGGGSSNSGGSYHTNNDYAGSYDSTDSVGMNDNAYLKENFYDFEELYSNDEYLVYTGDNVGNNCKIVVHYENDKVTGMDYYFDFDTEELAIDNIEVLSKDFEKFGTIVQNGDCIKIIIREDVYSDLSIDTLRSNFSKFKELIKD